MRPSLKFYLLLNSLHSANVMAGAELWKQRLPFSPGRRELPPKLMLFRRW